MVQVKARALAVIALILAALLAGCSPEATRTRGQMGGDVGNWGRPVEIHGQVNPYHDTAPVGQAIKVENQK